MRWLPRAALVVCALAPMRAGADAPEPSPWLRLVSILQYLESDYPAAVQSRSPTELAEQAGFADEAVDTARELGPDGAPFVPKLEALAGQVRRVEDPSAVQQSLAALVDELVAAGGVARSPRSAPDLARGEQLYAVGCAACHGADGSARVELAPTMDPRPANLLDPAKMDPLTPFKAFNVVSFGVAGTAMPSYSVLDETERWDLAFYVFTLRQPPCTGKTPQVPLEKLANSTDPELAKSYSPEEIACLRRKPPQPDEEQSLLAARGGIDDALRLAGAGNLRGAKKAVLDAYLNGIEPVEPLLRARDPGLVQRIESAFGRARLSADSGGHAFTTDAREVIALIDLARRSHSRTDAGSVFVMTLFILLREGFEAMVVIAALLAVLKKTGQTAQARTVHWGWSLALLCGGAGFVFARHALAGTRQEWIEAVVALIAVGMLLYAALWLNTRKNIRKMMSRIRERMAGALDQGGGWGLFGIAFTAVLRESFETALFLQGLSIDSPAGVAWGAAVGLLVTAGFVVFVVRVGYRLPMKALFNASTVILFATAVVLLGKGLHALQELGALGVHPLPLFTLDFLGIYPDGYTLIPQLLLALAPLAYRLIRSGGEIEPPMGLDERPTKS